MADMAPEAAVGFGTTRVGVSGLGLKPLQISPFLGSKTGRSLGTNRECMELAGLKRPDLLGAIHRLSRLRCSPKDASLRRPSYVQRVGGDLKTALPRP